MSDSAIEKYKSEAIKWLEQHYEILDKEWVELVRVEDSLGVTCESERIAYLSGHRHGIDIAIRFFKGLPNLKGK